MRMKAGSSTMLKKLTNSGHNSKERESHVTNVREKGQHDHRH
jgi:hypothetical protein